MNRLILRVMYDPLVLEARRGLSFGFPLFCLCCGLAFYTTMALSTTMAASDPAFVLLAYFQSIVERTAHMLGQLPLSRKVIGLGHSSGRFSSRRDSDFLLRLGPHIPR